MNKWLSLTLILFIQFSVPIYAQTVKKAKLVVQLGHSGTVKSAIFSPDGKLIASNGQGGIIIWQASTGSELRVIRGIFSAIDFAPDSKSVVATETTEDNLEEEERKKPFSIEIFSVSDGKLLKKFPAHKNKINSVKFSRDGKSILTASDDHTAKLWNVIDGSLVRIFAGHTSEVSCAVFSPDNKFIATSGTGSYISEKDKFIGDSTARIWEAATGREIKKITHIDEGLSDFEGIGFIQFSPDGKFLVTSAKQPRIFNPQGYTIRIWDWSTGKLLFRFFGSGPAIFSPNGKYILADIYGKTDNKGNMEQKDGFELIDLQSGKSIFHFDNYDWSGQIKDFSFSPDSKYILVSIGLINSGGRGVGMVGEESLRIYEAESGKEIYNLGQNLQQVEQLSSSNDEKIILAGNYVWNLEKDGLVKLENFKPENLEREFDFQLPRRILSGDGKMVAESFNISEQDKDDAGIQIWNTENGREINKLSAEQWKTASFTPDNQFILAESPSDVCLWRISDAKDVWCYDYETAQDTYTSSFVKDGYGFSVLSKDAKTVFIRKDGNTLIALNTITGKEIWNTSIEMSPSPGIFLSTDNKYLIVPTHIPYTDSEFLSFLDTKTHKEVFKIEAQNVYSTNNQNVLIGYRESIKQIVLINKNTGKTIAVLPKELNPYVNNSNINFESLDTYLKRFLATYNDEIRLYDLNSGKVLRTFKGHDGNVSNAMFFNNDNYIISSSLDGTTRIWDVKTGKELCSLISFDNGRWFVTTPDGRFDTNDLESSSEIHWSIPDEPLNPLPVEIFIRDYFEPKLLARILKGEKFPPIRDLSTLNHTQPRIEIKEITQADSPDTIDVTVETENVRSEYQKATDKKALNSGVFDLRLFRDGQLVAVSTPKDKLEKFITNVPHLAAETKTSNVSVDTPEDTAWQETNNVFKLKSENVKRISPEKLEYTFRNVKLPHDGRKEVEFTAYAFNSDKVKSATTEPFKFSVSPAVVNSPKKGRAYLISIGINASENPAYDLHYAANDARKMQEIVGSRLRADSSKYSEVVQVPLISDYDENGKLTENTAQKAIIKSVFSLLSGNEKEVPGEILKQIPNHEQIKVIEPEDTLIITYSGHGYTDQSGIFYMLPYDIGRDTMALTPEALSKTISSDELSLWMQDITASEMIMIIDACHSSAAVQGAGFKPGPMGSRGLGQLAYDKDMKILSATQADNVALELGSLQQGLLSYALLEDGINKSLADTDKDKRMLSVEWLSYAETRVPKLYEEVRNKKRNILIDGKAVTGEKGIELAGAKSKKNDLELQRPSLFDFKRRNIKNTLFYLP